jgi:hypothetical protein
VRREKFKKIAVTSLLTLLALILVSTSLISNVHAATFPMSSNVAVVPSLSCSNGGTLASSGFPNGDTFTFTAVSVASIADGTGPNPLVGYDTVLLMAANFNFATQWADSDFSSRILAFVNGGGKLIIYDSERANVYSAFVYPFTVNSPGATGSSGGSIQNLQDDTLSSNNTLDASYVNLPLMASTTDAVGDSNVMTTVDSHWYIDIVTRNVNNVAGPVHTYAFYGAGLIIYNGLDVDYASSYYGVGNANGPAVINMIWYLELLGQVLPPGTGTPSASGLSLTPPTATNPLGQTHTVTAYVTDQYLNPIPGVSVDFEITSGPNAGATGTATTDSDGFATFSWTSSTVGTDTVTATIMNAAGATVEATAEKTWVPGNQIPEGPFGTIALSTAMLVGIGLFFGRNKIVKAIKL